MMVTFLYLQRVSMATLMYMTVTYQHVEKEGGVVGHHHHHFLEEVEGQLHHG